MLVVGRRDGIDTSLARSHFSKPKYLTIAVRASAGNSPSRWNRGALTTGRVLDYSARPEDDRKLCSLYLSLMNRMDVRVPRFGDAHTQLAGL